MGSRVPLLFLCSLLLASAFLAANADDDGADDLVVGQHYYVVSWPGTLCRVSKCCPPATAVRPASDFSIGGLWPYDITVNQPVTHCCPNKFYNEQLDDLRDDLGRYWSDLSCPSSNGVRSWRNAWRVHGTCTNMNQTTYFERTLDIRSRVDLLFHFRNRGITPSWQYQYTKSWIERVIEEAIGASPQITCIRGPMGVFHLQEIRICLDKDAADFTECSSKQGSSSCPDRILFPPFYLYGDVAANATAAAAAYPIEMVVEAN